MLTWASCLTRVYLHVIHCDVLLFSHPFQGELDLRVWRASVWLFDLLVSWWYIVLSYWTFSYSHILYKVSLTCVFDERQFDCGTTFLSTANPALVVGDKVKLLMISDQCCCHWSFAKIDNILLLLATTFLGGKDSFWNCLDADITFGRCTLRWGWPGAGGRVERSAGWSRWS